MKSHRYCLLVYMKKHGILDLGDYDWSLLMGSNAKDMVINGDFSYFYKNLMMFVSFEFIILNKPSGRSFIT